MMAAESNLSAVSLVCLLEGLGVEGPVVDAQYPAWRPTAAMCVAGYLFLACQGLQVHGLAHVEQAIRQGAVAVVWEPVSDARIGDIASSLSVPTAAIAGLSQKLSVIADRFYAHPREALHVIGVTGTDGKTSVTHFIAQALCCPARSAVCSVRSVTVCTARCKRRRIPRRIRCACRKNWQPCVISV